MSKGLASTGGFVVGTHELVDTIRARARSFQFSTAGVPSSLGAALASVRVARSGGEGRALAARSAENSRFLRSALDDRGVDVGRDPNVAGVSTSPIVPVHVGDDLRAIRAWRTLFESGIYCNTAFIRQWRPGPHCSGSVSWQHTPQPNSNPLPTRSRTASISSRLHDAVRPPHIGVST